MSIKATLIHLLGGITEQESETYQEQQYFIGKSDGLRGLKQYADSLNGTNADDWSKCVYHRIEENLDEADRLADAE